MRKDVWASGDAYEPFIGRWSRLVAHEFVAWLSTPKESRWLDVGCGTGALSQTILERGDPAKVVGLDPSEGFVQFARDHIRDLRASFVVGNALALPDSNSTYDAAVSGLVLNFVPQPDTMVSEMKRVTRPGGTVALYVWDYAGKMELLKYFWDAAMALDPTAAELDEGLRFPICNPEPLEKLFRAAGLDDVQIKPIDAPALFRDFDDYWSPFLGGQGPAPSYAKSLSDEKLAELRESIRTSLPIKSNGSIDLIARAWAVRGIHP